MDKGNIVNRICSLTFCQYSVIKRLGLISIECANGPKALAGGGVDFDITIFAEVNRQCCKPSIKIERHMVLKKMVIFFLLVTMTTRVQH